MWFPLTVASFQRGVNRLEDLLRKARAQIPRKVANASKSTRRANATKADAPPRHSAHSSNQPAAAKVIYWVRQGENQGNLAA